MTRTVLLSGGGTHNVGAYLLAMAAASGAREHLGAELIAVPLGQRELAAELGPSALECRWMRGDRLHGHRFPRAVVNHLGLPLPAGVSPDDIDVVLDISGFAFGAPWPARTSRRLAADLRYWRRRGTRFCFLPQSFGPLQSIGASAHRTLREELPPALVFAREVESEHNVRAIAPSTRIAVAKDIVLLWPTSLLRREVGVGRPVPDAERRALIVPNQMIIETRAAALSDYLSAVVVVADELIARGLEPAVLIAATQDHPLGRLIEDRTGLPVVRPASMADTVRAVATSAFVWSSRYHCSLLAFKFARSVVSVGWSAKYPALHKLFHSPTAFAPAETTTASQVAHAIDAASGAVPEPPELDDEYNALWHRVADFADLGGLALGPVARGGPGG